MAPTARDIAINLEDLVPYDFYPYATYVENRTNGGGPAHTYYKRHKTLAHAKTAIKGGGNGRHLGETRVYEWSPELAIWKEITLD